MMEGGQDRARGCLSPWRVSTFPSNLSYKVTESLQASTMSRFGALGSISDTFSRLLALGAVREICPKLLIRDFQEVG